MRVLLLANNGTLVPASRTRVFQYVPHLRHRDVDVDVEVVVPDEVYVRGASGGRIRKAIYYASAVVRAFAAGVRTLIRSGRYDAILVQRVLFPFPIPLLFRAIRRKVVFDFDDAIFTTESPDASVADRLRTWFHARSVEPILTAASHAIVENDYTAAYAERFCPQVSIITGPIDTDRYVPGRGRDETEVVLGWIGSPSTAPYLETIREPLARIGERFPSMVVRIIGADAPEIPGVKTESLPWGLDREVGDLQTFDIGLMPLPDDPWTRGKGGYKLLQYGAMGIASVASPVGVNREIVEDGVSGLLADTEADWVDALVRLIEDEEERIRMGAAARERMLSQYALAKAADRLHGILTERAEAAD